ncbi:hypothetical protein L3Q82_016279, partial [Scortum barcoo]
MATHGYNWTVRQCREKLKKLKSDYWTIKDHNGWSGSNRKEWKWFGQMDAIYGHRPASNGREIGVDSAMALLETVIEAGKRKRVLTRPDLQSMLGEMQSEDERNRAQRDHHVHLLLGDA